MTVASATQFAEALRQYRLLETEQQEKVDQELQARFSEPRALAKELLRRDWLTAYQVNQIFQGRAKDLLLGSYVLQERLGEGGMGQVFKARNWKLGQTVAVKLIRKERLASSNAVQRFRREMHLAARLNHPNVVRAFDADEVNGAHFFVMEFVQGIHLSRLVKQHGPLPVVTACEYVRQAALGLQHAFEQGMVHRDIKPDNLLLTGPRGASDGGPGSGARSYDSKQGVPNQTASAPSAPTPSPDSCMLSPDSPSRPIVKILDMGLARLDQPAEDTSALTAVTVEGMVMGTPDYMAPEQVEDSHGVDIRGDIYSLGCTFYFLITGRPPFPGGTFMQKLDRHRFQEPVPAEQMRGGVSPAVASVIRRLMAKRPEDRFQTPAELAETLARLLADPAALAEADPVQAGVAAIPVAVAAPSDSGTTADQAADQAALATPQPHVAPPPLIVLHRGQGTRGVNWPLLIAVAAGAVAVLLLLAALRNAWIHSDRPKTDDPIVAPPKPTPPKKVGAEGKPPPADPFVFPPGPVTDEWIAAVHTQPPDYQAEAVRAKLKQLNAQFNGKYTHKVDPKTHQVVEFFVSADTVTDLSALRALGDLRILKCHGSDVGKGKLEDLDPLRGLALSELDVSHTKVADLSPLEGMKLKKLNIQDTAVTSLAPLKELPLEELICTIQPDRDLWLLNKMPTLKKINGEPAAKVLKVAP